MKKILFTIAIIAIAAVTVFVVKQSPVSSVSSNNTIAESKTVSMQVFTNNNYTNAVYDATSAALTVKVKKAGSKNNEVVWEKSFPALTLKFFPAAINAFTEAIKIPALFKHDVLQISYVLTYNSGGSSMQVQGDEVVDVKQGNAKISINI